MVDALSVRTENYFLDLRTGNPPSSEYRLTARDDLDSH